MLGTSWFWKPWSQSTALDLAKEAHEKTVLDLKETCDLTRPTHAYELAKDMAAFANALGGTVLIGASERSDPVGRKTGRIEAFVPLADAHAVMKAATLAARDLCRPGIVVEPETFKLTIDEQATIVGKPLPHDATLVALNIHPLIASPTGVVACDADGNRVPHAFRFPLRFIEGTKWLAPEELAFHMNSHERRMYLLLAPLPGDVKIFVWDKGIGALGARRPGTLAKLDAERLIAEFEMGGVAVHVPLTFVQAVWLDENKTWNVDVKGGINTTESRGNTVRFVPLGSVA